MLKWIVRNIIRPKWVVFQTVDGKEFGIKIWGVIVSCYKGETYYPEDFVDLRSPQKRELGESLLVPHSHASGWTPGR